MIGKNPICQVNYAFNRVKKNRTKPEFKTPKHFFNENMNSKSESKLR